MIHRYACLAFFHGGYTSLFFLQQCSRIAVFHTFVNNWVFLVFNFSHFVVGILVLYCDFNLHFLFNDVECFHLHIDHIDIHIFKVLKCFFKFKLEYQSSYWFIAVFFMYVTHICHIYVLQLSSPNLWLTFSFPYYYLLMNRHS